MKKHIYFGFVFSVVLMAAGHFRTTSAQTKTLTPDDLFRLEEIGAEVLSPDGQWLAYVLRRPKVTAINHKHDFLQGNDRADIWIVATSGGQPVNLTKGSADGIGYWNPVWSPDSKKLVILSTRGDNVFPWLLDRESAALKQLSDRAYDMQGGIAWLSDHTVAITVLPAGKKPLSMTVEMQVADVATREWPKAWAGKESTASVLESGVPSGFDKRKKDALVFIDTSRGTSQTVAEGMFGDLTLSPDKRYLAAMERADILQPTPDRLLVHILEDRHELALFSVDGKRVSIGKETEVNFLRGSVRWSPDSGRIAMMGRKPESSGIYVYRVGGDRPEIVTGDDIVVPDSTANPSGILWSSNNTLVIRAEGKHTSDPQAKRRSDWWAVSTPGQARNLTASMKTPPSQLVAEKSGDSFVGPADNKLWRFSANGGTASEIGAGSDAKLT